MSPIVKEILYNPNLKTVPLNECCMFDTFLSFLVKVVPRNMKVANLLENQILK